MTRSTRIAIIKQNQFYIIHLLLTTSVIIVFNYIPCLNVNVNRRIITAIIFIAT